MSNGKSYLVVDIETAGLDFEDQGVLDYLEEKDIVPALHPYFSRVISIGLKQSGGEPVVLHGEDEKKLLQDFWAYLRESQAMLIVTFNGYRFDIPFLNVRSVMNGIKPDTSINLNKWTMGRSNHFDIMQALSGTGVFSWVRLEITAKIFGVPVPEDTIPSDQMPVLFRQGDWDSIIKHNTHDIMMSEAIYLKIRDLY